VPGQCQPGRVDARGEFISYLLKLSPRCHLSLTDIGLCSQVIGAAPGTHTDVDWHETWKASPEFQANKEELRKLKQNPRSTEVSTDPSAFKEFAASFWVQLREVTVRVAQQYWRTPIYIFSKTALCVLVPLFIGFSFFKADNSQQGLQNQSVFCSAPGRPDHYASSDALRLVPVPFS
jgi:hypothetical protein